MDKQPLKYLVKEFQYPGVSTMLQAILKNQAQWLVEYEVIDMSSSRLGMSKWLCVGPSCTIKTLEDAEKHRVDTDLASTTKWPVRYIEVCDPWDHDTCVLNCVRTAALCTVFYERWGREYTGELRPDISGDYLKSEVDRLESDSNLQHANMKQAIYLALSSAHKALKEEFRWLKQYQCKETP